MLWVWDQDGRAVLKCLRSRERERERLTTISHSSIVQPPHHAPYSTPQPPDTISHTAAFVQPPPWAYKLENEIIANNTLQKCLWGSALNDITREAYERVTWGCVREAAQHKTYGENDLPQLWDQNWSMSEPHGPPTWKISLKECKEQQLRWCLRSIKNIIYEGRLKEMKVLTLEETRERALRRFNYDEQTYK